MSDPRNIVADLDAALSKGAALHVKDGAIVKLGGELLFIDNTLGSVNVEGVGLAMMLALHDPSLEATRKVVDAYETASA